MQFSEYQRLQFERRPNGVLLITINRPDKLNAADAQMSHEFTTVWPDVSADPETRVAVITGAGNAFSAGGDISSGTTRAGDLPKIANMLDEARSLVVNMLNCDKPIVSAVNGVAVGAGLAVALLADISIIGDDVRFTDGHMRIGLAAGDHAAIAWPLLCGIAKAKYYLLTADFIDGKEADRIGLVSKSVPNDEVLSEALRVADKLGRGPQLAQNWTKMSMNHWLRNAQPAFEASLALEMLTFFSADAEEGLTAMLEKRSPSFPSGTTS